ncbi:hypothetical protein MMC07_000951 [Pseudocyphellaria aurata]|nr:hypothetical protein [Pseudocyphellaria aurata]
MLSHKDPDKAQRYLHLLDEARCSGDWEEVSRLRLKIAKHAPQRKCLQVTVATEYALSTQPSDRPSTSSSITPFKYGQRVPEILTALKYGNPTPEDAFQAEICLSWLHWIIKEPSLAFSRIPTDLGQIPNRLTPEEGKLSGWTHVCIAKGAYIRGICLEDAGNLEEAVQTYESMLPYISSTHSTFGNTSEHRAWTQSLIARHCLLSSRYVKSKARQPQELLSSSSLFKPNSLLAPFRAWAEFWDVKPGRDLKMLDDTSNKGEFSRKSVWLAYYDTLSTLLQIEHTYSSTSSVHTSGKGYQQSETTFFSIPRPQQCAELHHVESIYEGFLLNELSFPKANEHSPEIEAWVDQVVANWKFICRPGWLDKDNADVRKTSTSRRVLAILYQAATRSFHSPRILRYLFMVHTSLADFHLAGKALNSYFEIVKKGKARVEKSGEKERSLDDDATVIWTAAEGIKILCFYGRRKEAERANELAALLEKWLQPHYDYLSNNQNDTHENLNVPSGMSASAKSHLTNAVAAGFCALGISQARWASLTYETSTRSELHTRSIENFRIASGASLENESNVEILYHLALSLSQARDLDGAMSVIKRALSTNTDSLISKDSDSENEAGYDGTPDHHKRRVLVKSWHLLALLFSAKHNFSTAISSCEAALELFGVQSVSRSLKILDLATALELPDKESILTIKMTQIALAEVEDGPEEAVNSASELLSLYAKLFNYTEKSVPKHTTPNKTSPPTTGHGIMSLRGSFLGRTKTTSTKAPEPELTRGNMDSSSAGSEESPNAVTRTPTISVTTEDNSNIQRTSRHSHHLFHHEPKKLHKRNDRKSVDGDRKSRASSLSRISTGNSVAQNHLLSLRQAQDGEPPNALEYSSPLDLPSDEVGVAISHDLPSPPATKTFQSTFSPQQSKTSTHISQPTPTFQQSTNAPLSTPILPMFPPSLRMRHALTLLTKIWLLISSVYRRANMPTDAQGALSEASKQVTAIESAIANTDSSAEAFSAPDWGRLKSVAELWADVLAERGRLYLKLGDREAAEEAFEVALGWSEDHPGAIVGLSGILLDIYEPTASPLSSPLSPSSSPAPVPILANLPVLSSPSTSFSLSKPKEAQGASAANNEDENLLPRLAARDRAYGLLSSLTKSGRGWDCAEAWFALARVYEETGQLARAKEALWWVVQLEEGKGVRRWECVEGW